MKLSEIMSHAGLAGYAEVALVLFLLVFTVQAIRAWRRPWLSESRLPLADDDDAAREHHETLTDPTNPRGGTR